MVATTPRTRKPAPAVTVRPIDPHAGTWEALASAGDVWYTIDLRQTTCTCPAGMTGFTGCKHVPFCKHTLAAKVVARALAGMTPTDRAATLRVTPAIHVKVAALRECYAQ